MVLNLDNGADYTPFGSKPKATEEFARCSNCNFSYFEEVEIHRINKFAVVTMGQKTGKTAPGPFVFLRCAKCMTLHEPNLTYSTNQANTVYTEMKTELEREEKKEEEVKEPEVRG